MNSKYKAWHMKHLRQMLDIIITIISWFLQCKERGIRPTSQMKKLRPHTFLVIEPGSEMKLSAQGTGAHPLLQEAFLLSDQLALTPRCSSEHRSGLSALLTICYPEDGSTQIPSDWGAQLYLSSEAHSLLFPADILRSQMLETSLWGGLGYSGHKWGWKRGRCKREEGGSTESTRTPGRLDSVCERKDTSCRAWLPLPGQGPWPFLGHSLPSHPRIPAAPGGSFSAPSELFGEGKEPHPVEGLSWDSGSSSTSSLPPLSSSG